MGWLMMFRKFLCYVVMSLFCAALYAEDWIPVYEEPRHKLAFENDHAMILNVYLPPGYVSLYHEHRIDLLYVTVVGTKVWAEPLGGERREADVKTGDLRFSSDNHGLPHVHRVGNIGTTPFHVVGIGIKDRVSADTPILEGNTGAMALVMEKPHASVYRIRLQPGEKTGQHTHHLPYTRVYLSAGGVLDSDGNMQRVEAGDFLWQAGGESHGYENAGDNEITIIEMLWR